MLEGLLVLLTLLHLGSSDMIKGTKIVTQTFKCTESTWDEHKVVYCTTDVTVTGFPECNWGKEDVFKEKDVFYSNKILEGTCFREAILFNNETEARIDEDSKSLRKSMKSNTKDGDTYSDLSCSNSNMAMKNMFQTPLECCFFPIRLPEDCVTTKQDSVYKINMECDDVSHEVKKGVTVIDSGSSKENSPSCDVIPELGFRISGKVTTYCDKYPPAKKCEDARYNADIWTYYANLAFKVPNLDFFPPKSAINLNDSFCTPSMISFKANLKENEFCEQPDKTSFYKFKHLSNHYTTICDQKESFKVLLECLDIVEDAKRNQLSKDLGKCFGEADRAAKSDCEAMQLGSLCRPLLLRGNKCSSFEQLYTAEIRTRNWQECASHKAEIDPCKTTLSARFPRCDSGSSSVLPSTPLSFLLIAFITFVIKLN